MPSNQQLINHGIKKTAQIFDGEILPYELLQQKVWPKRYSLFKICVICSMTISPKGQCFFTGRSESQHVSQRSHGIT